MMTIAIVGIPGIRELRPQVCPAISPSLGDELLADGGMESWIDANNLTSWGKALGAGASLNQEDVDVYAGSYSARFDDAASGTYIYQNITAIAAGAWVRAQYAYKHSAGTSILKLQNVAVITAGDQTWALGSRAHRLTESVSVVYIQYNSGTTPVQRFDAASLKQFTFSTMLHYLGRRRRIAGTYACKPTVTTGNPAGLLIRYADENNFVLLHHNGTNAILTKRVAGTYTQLVSGAAAYAAERELKVIIKADGVTYQLWYHGAQIGADQTINDVLGNAVYGFSSLSTNTVGLVTTSKAVT